jgi:hypothetical protein
VDSRATQKANIEVVRRLLTECLGKGLVRHLPDLITDEYVGHLPIGDHYGPEGTRITIAAYRRMIPDLSVAVDDLFAEGDKVCRRFRLSGTAGQLLANGKFGMVPVVLNGLAIDRLLDGRLVESWVLIDNLPDGG